MDLQTLKDTSPWDWPDGAGRRFLQILRDDRAAESDRLLAAELAGGFTVINEELVDALLSILRRGGEPETLRGKAAISLGPVLSPHHRGERHPEGARRGGARIFMVEKRRLGRVDEPLSAVRT